MTQNASASQPSHAARPTSPLRRLQVGCGEHPADGWLNHERRAAPGVDVVGDLLDGLPLDDACVDTIVAMHVLQDLAWPDLPRALAELHRLLVPGGVMRLGLPDLDRAIEAYRRGDADYFYVPDDDAQSIGAKLVTQIIWYGSVRTPFTFDFAHELLQEGGFVDIVRCDFRRSRLADAAIAGFDNRQRESLFVEARRGA